MTPAIPRSCPVVVIEGIPGAGKTRLHQQLLQATHDRPLHAYDEAALLFDWTHAWIPGIHGLRLGLMQGMLDHIDATLAAQEDALFVLSRFHLSFALLGGDAGDAYSRVVARLGALGARVCAPIVPDEAIAARAVHSERRDPRWQAHLQRRLDEGGHPDITAMYIRYQQAMLDLLARQPLPYDLLPPQ
jgi:hypothetical protein